jgi:hypothetical protein
MIFFMYALSQNRKQYQNEYAMVMYLISNSIVEVKLMLKTYYLPHTFHNQKVGRYLKLDKKINTTKDGH